MDSMSRTATACGMSARPTTPLLDGVPICGRARYGNAITERVGCEVLWLTDKSLSSASLLVCDPKTGKRRSSDG